MTQIVPRYFFNFEGESSATADLIGQDFADDERAKAEGAKLAAELATNKAIEGELPTYEWLEVVDESQRPVARMRVADAIHEPNRRV